MLSNVHQTTIRAAHHTGSSRVVELSEVQCGTIGKDNIYTYTDISQHCIHTNRHQMLQIYQMIIIHHLMYRVNHKHDRAIFFHFCVREIWPRPKTTITVHTNNNTDYRERSWSSQRAFNPQHNSLKHTLYFARPLFDFLPAQVSPSSCQNPNSSLNE